MSYQRFKKGGRVAKSPILEAEQPLLPLLVTRDSWHRG